MITKVEKAEKQNPYLWVHYCNGGKKLVVGTVQGYCRAYPSLIKINRSTAINTKTIAELTKGKVLLNNGETLRVSRRRFNRVNDTL